MNSHMNKHPNILTLEGIREWSIATDTGMCSAGGSLYLLAEDFGSATFSVEMLLSWFSQK